MRKLIESTLVSLDGVIEAPERWASFDAEATALSIEQLGNYDAFVMGRVTYEKFYANWGHITDNLHRPHQRHAQIRRIPVADRDGMECHRPQARRIQRDRPTEGPARQGPHQIWHQPLRQHARARPPDRRVPLLDHARRGRLRATAVPGRGHLRARPQAHRPEEAGKRVGDPHLCARLTSVRYPKRAESAGAPSAERPDMYCAVT